MRWHGILGLLLLAGSGYIGRDLMRDSEHPWPAYAEPQANCDSELSGSHDGAAVKFRYPTGWKVGERQDPATGIVQTFLAPPDGGTEVAIFLREAQVRTGIVTVPEPAAPGAPRSLRDAPAAQAPAPAEAPGDGAPGEVRLKDTDQALAFEGKRVGSAYLTRLDEEARVSFSWMAFVWDEQRRMTAVSGPKLVHTNWPLQRQRNRRINCGFWETLRTLEAK